MDFLTLLSSLALTSHWSASLDRTPSGLEDKGSKRAGRRVEPPPEEERQAPDLFLLCRGFL
jgi:hypothetical protein